MHRDAECPMTNEQSMTKPKAFNRKAEGLRGGCAHAFGLAVKQGAWSLTGHSDFGIGHSPFGGPAR
jgi:hypothetical protein